MNKIKIIILISTCICVLFGIFFLWIRSPVSLSHIMRKLDSYLETEYEYISTEQSVEGLRTVTYHFEDINGVEFYVITFPRFGDYDTSQPGYPRCNYLTAYYEFNKESIENSLQCGLPVIWKNVGIYSGFRIEVSNYYELEILSSAIEKALTAFTPLISENYSGTASDKFEFYKPEISIWTIDGHIISVFDFRLIKRQPLWTQEEVLNQLHRDYTEKVPE